MSDKNSVKQRKTLFASNNTQKQKTAKNSAKTLYNAKHVKTVKRKTNKTKQTKTRWIILKFVLVFVAFVII